MQLYLINYLVILFGAEPHEQLIKS